MAVFSFSLRAAASTAAACDAAAEEATRLCRVARCVGIESDGPACGCAWLPCGVEVELGKAVPGPAYEARLFAATCAPCACINEGWGGRFTTPDVCGVEAAARAGLEPAWYDMRWFGTAAVGGPGVCTGAGAGAGGRACDARAGDVADADKR